MSHSGLLWNPPIPGTVRRGRGRPKGSLDRGKRKTPNRYHLRKAVMEQEKNKIPIMTVKNAKKRPRPDEVAEDDTDNDNSQRDNKRARTEEQELHRIPDIHKEPCTVLMCGKSGAGKTTAIFNMLNRRLPYHNKFLITGTKHKNNLNFIVEGQEECILEGFDDNFVKMLTDFHKEHPKARTLLCFDDHVGIEFNFKASKAYKKLCAASRNFGITIIDSCQDIAEIPKILRRNAHWLFFGNNYDANNDMIAEQLSFPDLEKPVFRRLLKKIAKERKYQWMCYDDKNQDWWIWQPEKVEGLGHDESDDDEEEEEDENKAPDPSNVIKTGELPTSKSAESKATTKAVQDAAHSRGN